MGRIQKKGVKGAASNFITRQQALKKLQISLADFRRICILKGIYPREPRNKKKANKGSTAPVTFYYVKDIQYLLHEPLLAKFRAYKAFAKKLNTVLHKGEISSAKSLSENNRPSYTLDHIIKERYPTFVDAVRDMDDAISMLYLFSKMPVDNRIKAKTVKSCQTLIAEFQNYVMNAKCIRKVFFSIKGIYYQADIKGQTVTWVVPYQFSTDVPTDVDFRVMTTFLDFYITLMGFVNYRLYNELNISYPPKLDSNDYFKLDKNVTGGKKRVDVGEDDDETTALDDFKSTSKSNNNNDDDDESATVTLQQIQDASNEVQSLQQLFKDHTFFLSRETPRYALEFMIRSCGGQVSWDASVGGEPPFPESDERITIQVCDRPKVNNRVLSRAYVQPQWIADSINARKLIKTSLYEPGELLPPHLSPFVEAKEGDYVPSSAGVSFSDYKDADDDKKKKKKANKKKRTAEELEREEQKEMATVMMSNKQRKLYNRMQESNQKKSDLATKLEQKKKALKAKK
ncbi:Pescadillo N-terminus-domain-containing protein [Halteromyces radiatus]|uniref:Pescadillo N-terminus-domain-containing protein n=1 Tax=Halteromyces radiatus TaxID=101107 RepID=UPI00221F2522|nr:Pescadillo N-terminus-domain-containing protein [Halteromyces radiatus]KAI8093376.1 Pescadillo N-terminus-domain-containing protein [Halteromyces radiatus]